MCVYIQTHTTTVKNVDSIWKERIKKSGKGKREYIYVCVSMYTYTYSYIYVLVYDFDGEVGEGRVGTRGWVTIRREEKGVPHSVHKYPNHPEL